MKKLSTSNFSSSETTFNFKSGILILVFSIICYLPFLVNFLWGNHDWGWVKENTPLWSGVFEGRFSQFFLQTLLFDKKILPILTLLSALSFFTAAAILLFNLWNIPQQKCLYFLLGLNLIIAPYTLSWLYFAFITLSCLSWPLFIILGFWLLTHQRITISLPLSAICFTLALGGYPPVINLIAVIFFTLIINDISLKNHTPKEILKKYIPHTMAMLLALLCFMTIQHILKKLNLQYDTYNTAGVSLNDLVNKIKLLSTALIKQFIITTSFISKTYKLIWLTITISAIIVLYKNTSKHFSHLFLLSLALLGLLFSPLITTLAAQNVEYVMFEPRIEFFGLIYIYIFSAAILLKTNHIFIKNITYFLLTFSLLYNFNTNAYASKVWKMGFIAENNLMERFIKRVEDNPNFSPNTTYTFVQGGTLDFRSRYYLKDGAYKIDSYTQTAPYIPWHLPSKAYKFYYPTDFFGLDFDVYWSFVPAYQLNLVPDLVEYLDTKSSPWPQSDSVYINKDTIIFTMTPTGKTQAKTWINRQNLSPFQ